MRKFVHYTYWKWEGVLSPEFCRSALEQIDWATSQEGSVVNEHTVIDPTYRRSDIVWQNAMQPLGCIARTYLEVANQSAEWNYVLGSQEDTQLTRYKSSDEGFYDWHIDAAPPQNGIQRKLSCVILLNDASEFEGGALQLKGAEDQILLEKRGSIIVFPSFMEHKVTPVTKGVRYTAVTWASGPSFK